MADIKNLEEISRTQNNTVIQAESVRKRISVPIWKKCNLTLEEAAAYSNIGINKIRSLSEVEECEWVLWVGNKRLIRRREFLRFLEGQYSL